MKRQYLILFLLSALVIGFSCSKKADTTTTPTSTSTTSSSTTSTTSTTTPAPTPNSIGIVAQAGIQNDSSFSLQLNFQTANISEALTTITPGTPPSTSITIVCDKVRASNGDSLKVEIDLGIDNDTKQDYSVDASTNTIQIEFWDISNKGAGGKNKAHILYGVQYSGTSGHVDLMSSGTQFQTASGGNCIGKFDGYFTIGGDVHTGFKVTAGSGLFSTKVQ